MTENSHIYQREHMPETVGDREVERIVGNPSRIASRAQAIEDLGLAMHQAANTLQLFADGDIGSGESLQAIRDQARETFADLKTAGERYLPSGEALADYAAALDAVQADTNILVTQAHSTWDDVVAASRALSAAQSDQEQWDFDEGHDQEPEGTRPSTTAEQAAFDSAVESWESYWGGYDAPVALWESAYNAAFNGLQSVNANGVTDGFWDNAMPFIEGMLTVLTWVGIALLIAAFFITGPLAAVLAALAVVAGVLSVLGEIAKFGANRGDWLSLTMSVVGILPFGKLAKIIDIGADSSKFLTKLGLIGRELGSEFTAAGAAFRQLDDFTRSSLGIAGTARLPWGPHGLRSQLMMDTFHAAPFFATTTGWIGSVGGGWRALAGFPPGVGPRNINEAIGGVAQGFASGLSGLAGLAGLVDD